MALVRGRGHMASAAPQGLCLVRLSLRKGQVMHNQELFSLGGDEAMRLLLTQLNRAAQHKKHRRFWVSLYQIAAVACHDYAHPCVVCHERDKSEELCTWLQFGISLLMAVVPRLIARACEPEMVVPTWVGLCRESEHGPACGLSLLTNEGTWDHWNLFGGRTGEAIPFSDN